MASRTRWTRQRIVKQPGQGGSRRRDRWNLSDPIVDFTGTGDLWTIRDACEGVCVTGGNGSGKTQGSGRFLSGAYLRAGFGGMVMTSKASDVDDWISRARKAGRESDLVVFSPRGEHRFNVVEYLLRETATGAASSETIVHAVKDLVAVIANRGSQIDGGEPIWGLARDELVRNAIDLIRLAGRPPTFLGLSRLVRSGPRSRSEFKQLADDAPSESEFATVWREARRRYDAGVRPLDRHSFDETVSYWRDAWTALPDDTRGSVAFTLDSALSPFLRGDLAEHFCTETNLTPEAAIEGKIIVLAFPTKIYLEAGAAAQAIFKYAFQKAIERRSVPDHGTDRPVFLWVDEAQEFVAPHDLKFQATARSARACSVFLTQNVDSLRHRIGREETENFTGLLQTKIWHANEGETNTWAAELIGQDWRYAKSFGADGGISFGEQVAHIVDPVTFTRLARGAPVQGGWAEAIVFKPGANWHGRTFLRCRFRVSD